MLRKLNNSNKGFTIIEVMIVLAIAGLIMLVVFLAVPALQRSQRNNARNGDANRVSASVVGFVANNNSRTPGNSTAGAYTQAQAATDAGNIKDDVGTPGQYSFSSTVGASGANTNAAVSNSLAVARGTVPAISVDAVQIVTYATCNSNGSTTVSTNGRAIALQYALEKADGTFQGYCNPVQS